jgi:hypothetical protein
MTARTKTPTKRGHSAAIEAQKDFDERPTEVYNDDPTIDEAMPPGAAPPQFVAVSMKTPAGDAADSRVIAISMKTPSDAIRPPVERELPHVKLRAMSEMSRAQIPLNLGNLAPPYDPAAARKRTVREYIVWASLAVILACGIALVVWFAAT